MGHRAAAQQGRSGAGVIELAVLAPPVLKVLTKLNTWPLVQFALKILHLQPDLITVLVLPECSGMKQKQGVTIALKILSAQKVPSIAQHVPLEPYCSIMEHHAVVQQEKYGVGMTKLMVLAGHVYRTHTRANTC